MKIIFATTNEGKLKEMKDLLADLDMEIVSALEAEFLEEIVEDGKTFAENALKKALAVSAVTDQWAVADDSGICFEALNGEPGVFSARWAGEDASAEDIVNYSLQRLKEAGQEKRGASFHSVAALASPDGQTWLFEGEVRGRVPEVPRGSHRPKLPYDVIFIPEGHERTFAEMTDEEKNALSHRGLAFQKLKEFLKEKLTNF